MSKLQKAMKRVEQQRKAGRGCERIKPSTRRALEAIVAADEILDAEEGACHECDEEAIA